MTGTVRRLTPGNLLAALAIIACVGLVLYRGSPSAQDGDALPQEEAGATVLLELQSKLLAGVAQIDRQRAANELAHLTGFKGSPAGRRAMAATHAYLLPPDSRTKALDLLPPPGNRDALDDLAAEAIAAPARLSAEDRSTLRDQMKWFGLLLLASSDSQAAQEVSAACMRAVTLAGLASVAISLAFSTGLVLLCVAAFRRFRGTLPFAFQPAPERSNFYFQGFAIYLAGMILLSSLERIWGASPSANLAGSAVTIAVSLILGLSYPLLRKVPLADWRADLGLHRGKGVLRETAAGIAAYLALLPLLACGLALTLFLQKITASASGEEPGPISHPIYGMMPGAGPLNLALLFFVAAVLAPCVEEVMFRGAFYGALRSFAGRTLSLLLMSFVFASLHPQGVFAIPSLMAIAVSFGLMREWRSSLVAGAVTHGLHNGTLLLGTLLLLA